MCLDFQILLEIVFAEFIVLLLFLAAIFAIVGNRGLIRNSARYAWLDIPQAKPAPAQTAPSAQQ